MDNATIEAIAREIAKHLPYLTYMQLGLQAVIGIAAGLAAAYLGSYFKERGKNLATKADFDALLHQLMTNTRAVEQIRSDLAREDWADREWKLARRTSLIALMEKANECIIRLDQQRAISASGGHQTFDRDPLADFEAIAALYFPELHEEAFNFARAYANLQIAQTKLGISIGEAKIANRPTLPLVDAFRENEFGPLWKNLVTAKSVLLASAKNLLLEIIKPRSRDIR